MLIFGEAIKIGVRVLVKCCYMVTCVFLKSIASFVFLAASVGYVGMDLASGIKH